MTYKNGAKEYAITFLVFGGIMGLVVGLSHASVLSGIVGGGIAGGLFTLLMMAFIKALEKKFDAMRREIAGERPLYCDGGATIAGNGGWLFFTGNGLEFYPHKANLSTAKVLIPLGTIASVSTKGNKLMVSTTTGVTYAIVVSKAALWAQNIQEKL